MAAAAPTSHTRHADINANAIVYVRLIGDSNRHYSMGNIQKPSLHSGSIIPVMVGQTLDFSNNAPRIQAIEISRVAHGQSLNGIDIAEDDQDVVCKASMNGSSEGPSFWVDDMRVLLAEGRIMELTGLACGVERKK